MSSYIQTNLIPGEEIAILRKPTTTERTAAIVIAVIALATIPMDAAWFTIFLGLVAALAYVRWNSTEYAITNKRVIVKTGAFSITTNEISMLKVESTVMKKSAFNSFGDVVVKGSGGQEVIFRAVDNPQEIRDFLFKEIEKNS